MGMPLTEREHQMPQGQFYRYEGVDYDLNRIYYRGQRDRRLFCIQWAPDREEEFYVCNKDGDPVAGVAMPEQWRLQKDQRVVRWPINAIIVT
jgi:hypothetical protein